MEVQEQSYKCKICNKSYVSGKSLGGHMRVHSSSISSSKKAKIKEFDDQNSSFQLNVSSKDQSNSSQEKIKNRNRNSDFVDLNQNKSYELRGNPKKSWRISDSKNGDSNKGVSCKECGKEFPSLQAVSGHMRWHSIKNKEMNQCKKCGKVFDSVRAMYGHMKSHSKRSTVADDSADSLSDLRSSFPVRRKRSRIRYNITPNPSFSSLNESTTSAVSEVEVAASCLLMLSKGLGDWTRLNPDAEYSGDDSVYFETGSSCKSKNDGDSLSDRDKMLTVSLSSRKLDRCVSGSVAEKTVSQFDDHDSKFAAEDEMKVGFENSDDWVLSVGNGMKVNLEVSDDVLPSLDKLKESEANFKVDQLECNNNQFAQESADVGIVCLGRASSGHMSDLYTEFTDSKNGEAAAVNQENGGIHDFLDLNFPLTVEGTVDDVGRNLWWIESGNEHQSLVLPTCQTNSIALSLN